MHYRDFHFLCEYVSDELFIPQHMHGGPWVEVLRAIMLQESAAQHRRQHRDGPARGYWQFERLGGVVGVLTHELTKHWMVQACERLDVDPVPLSLWRAIEFNDVLALTAARLLLYTVPHPLPKQDQPEHGWAQYIWAWRPGKPHRDAWADNWAEAWCAP